MKRAFSGHKYIHLPVICFVILSIISPFTVSHARQDDDVDVEVIVVGAGIAGLSAAIYLDYEDYDVLVLEKENRPGGRAISGEYQGFHYAKGTEYLGKPEGALKTIIDELDIEVVEIPGPTDADFVDGTFYYDEEGIALMFIEHSSREELNHVIGTFQQLDAEYDSVPFIDLDSEIMALDDMTAGEWFRSNGFSQFYYDHYNVASRGLFGANLEEISALSLIPEAAFDYEGIDLLDEDVVEDLENERVTEPYTDTDTYSLVGGITDITDAIAEELGDSIQYNSTVTEVVEEDDIYYVTYEDSDGEETTLTSYAVVLAVPAPVALWIAADVLSNEQIEIMQQIPYAQYITVTLFTDEPIFTDAFDLGVPNDYYFTDIYDTTWIQRYYDELLADAEAYMITAYIAPQSYTEDTFITMADEDILVMTYLDLEKIFPGVMTHILGSDIQRFPYAYPVMIPGAYRRLMRLHEITGDGLYLAGDYMIYPTFEDAADSGFLAAQALIEDDDE